MINIIKNINFNFIKFYSFPVQAGAVMNLLILLSGSVHGHGDTYDLFDNGLQYAIRVKKSEFILEVIEKPERVIRRFTVGYGRNPDRGPKLHEGDFRTPEGLYRITGLYSLAADPGTESRDYLEKLNKIYLRASDGHFFRKDPSKDLGFNAYGPRFFLLDYPNKNDLIRYEKALREGRIPEGKNGKPAGPGFGIAIHGNSDPDAQGYAASAGCITMNNEDIVQLDPYVRKGTYVLILP